MRSESELAQLRQIYACIIQGYATALYKDRTIYIRHFSPIEQAEVDEQYLSIFNNAKEKGLPIESERLKELSREKLWTDEDEVDLENRKFYIDNLRNTKKAGHLPSQTALITAQIVEGEQKLREKQFQRINLLGLTAEAFAFQKLNEIYIYKSFYRNKNFTEPFFSSEEYDELDRSEIAYLVNLYNTRIQDFSDGNLKKVALAPFFQNYFFLCDDNIFNLYGKPIVSLTYYQSELASYGKYFKSILSSENKPPADIMEDPEKIMDWVSENRNVKKIVDSPNKSPGEGGAMALVGAKASDIEQLGLKSEGAKSIQQLAKGKGGLSMEEMMKASGL